jgi:hypothetical protein
MYEERDLSHGEQMVECFKPFLRHLVSSGQSRKTLRSHRDNLWILGGEIISKLHEDPRLRKRPTDQIVLAVLDDEGGPLISHGSEDQQRSFDSTFRRRQSRRLRYQDGQLQRMGRADALFGTIRRRHRPVRWCLDFRHER